MKNGSVYYRISTQIYPKLDWQKAMMWYSINIMQFAGIKKFSDD